LLLTQLQTIFRQFGTPLAVLTWSIIAFIDRTLIA